VGTWPVMIDDATEVLDVEPGVRLTLKARAWPTGAAGVTLHLRPTGAETEVVIEEEAIEGPAALIPQPLLDVPLRWRNVETLRRLAFVAERRAAG
jgi:hypothetical protein